MGSVPFFLGKALTHFQWSTIIFSASHIFCHQQHPPPTPSEVESESVKLWINKPYRLKYLNVAVPLKLSRRLQCCEQKIAIGFHGLYRRRYTKKKCIKTFFTSYELICIFHQVICIKVYFLDHHHNCICELCSSEYMGCFSLKVIFVFFI